MIKIKNNEAITLISLIITVIILIILAGVVINFSLGENGIFKQAKYAKTETLKNRSKGKIRK
ncbi:MAG: hypothetical protein HFJ42_03215 [Clostridia bacterium]|nr:hypothetical protein [Clostridia bacterium]